MPELGPPFSLGPQPDHVIFHLYWFLSSIGFAPVGINYPFKNNILR